MTNTPKLKDFLPTKLKVSNPDRKLHHIFNEEDCYALWAAYSAGRPLLVRGQPGTGKSQMARAIAEQLGWAFVSEVVRGNTELSDLHWHYDAIGRLGEAQARGMPAGQTSNKPEKDRDRLDPVNFLAPGAFWWAYNWQTAQDQCKVCTTHLRPEPETPDAKHQQSNNWHPETGGVVLLLDEIDKAEPDLPNGLLETLGQYQFSVPYIDHPEQQNQPINPVTADQSRLLVIITTNEERELPKAFVRRCFVHTLTMEESTEPVNPDVEKGVEKRHEWLMERGRLHFGAQIDEAVYQLAATLLWDDRDAKPHSPYQPGLAEYIDLLNAVKELSHQEQRERLQKIAAYALKKELDS